MSEADLSGADLRGADLREAHQRGLTADEAKTGEIPGIGMKTRGLRS